MNALSFCANALRGLFFQRHLIVQLTRLEVVKRYKGSAMGLLWTLLTPLATLAVYTLAFSVIMGIRWGGSGGDGHLSFALALFAGLIPFDFFSQSLFASVQSIPGNPTYVKKVIFPTEILPVVSVGTALSDSAIRLFVFLVWALLSGTASLRGVCFLPLIFLPLLLLTAGLSWLVAALGAYLRDLPHLLAIILQLLFFVCPVIYPISMVPGYLRPIIMANPLSVLITWFREAALWGRLPGPFAYTAVLLLCGAVCMGGYWLFLRNKKNFGDLM